MMLRKTFRSAVLAIALAGAPLAAQTNTFSSGTVFNAPELTGFSTTGAGMVGMRVTWEFLGGGVGGSAGWGDLGGGFYGISSGGLTVSFSGTGDTFDGFGYQWSVINNSAYSLASLQFNGAPGRTIFDCAWLLAEQCSNNGFSAQEGTGGSARGWSLSNAGGSYAGSVFGFYSNMVSINGAAPVGDLFEQLRIVFGTGGLASELDYRFVADTDNSRFDRPIPTPSDVVPEPATMTLLATGLAGLAAARRRRRAKS